MSRHIRFSDSEDDEAAEEAEMGGAACRPRRSRPSARRTRLMRLGLGLLTDDSAGPPLLRGFRLVNSSDSARLFRL